MKCQEVMDYMQRFLDKDLNEQEHSLMTEHMEQCTSCAEMFERLNRLSDELDQLPKVTAPISIVDSILPTLNALESERMEQSESVSMSAWRKLRSSVSFRVLGGVMAASIVIVLMVIQGPHLMSNNSADDADLMNASDNGVDNAASEAGADMGAISIAEFMQVEDQHGAVLFDEEETADSDQSASSDQAEAPSARNGDQMKSDETADGGGMVGSMGIDGASGGAEEVPPAQERMAGEPQPSLAPDRALTFTADDSFGGNGTVVSPDQQYSAFVEAVEGGYQVIVTNAVGERIYASPLKKAESVAGLSWSDDSSLLSYKAETDGDVSVYTIDVAARSEKKM